VPGEMIHDSVDRFNSHIDHLAERSLGLLPHTLSTNPWLRNRMKLPIRQGGTGLPSLMDVAALGYVATAVKVAHHFGGGNGAVPFGDLFGDLSGDNPTFGAASVGAMAHTSLVTGAKAAWEYLQVEGRRVYARPPRQGMEGRRGV